MIRRTLLTLALLVTFALPAFPSLKRDLMSAEEGSAGRMPSVFCHFSSCSSDFTFSGAFRVGLRERSKTFPPNPFKRAAW